MDWLGLGTFITVCASALALVIKQVAGVSPATHLRRRDREAAWPPAEARSSEERGAPVRCAAPAQCYCARSVTVRRYCTCRSTLLPAGPAWSTARGLRAADQRGLAVRRRDWQAAQRRSCESLDLPRKISIDSCKMGAMRRFSLSDAGTAHTAEHPSNQQQQQSGSPRRAPALRWNRPPSARAYLAPRARWLAVASSSRSSWSSRPPPTTSRRQAG